MPTPPRVLLDGYAALGVVVRALPSTIAKRQQGLSRRAVGQAVDSCEDLEQVEWLAETGEQNRRKGKPCRTWAAWQLPRVKV